MHLTVTGDLLAAREEPHWTLWRSFYLGLGALTDSITEEYACSTVAMKPLKDSLLCVALSPLHAYLTVQSTVFYKLVWMLQDFLPIMDRTLIYHLVIHSDILVSQGSFVVRAKS